MSNEALVEPCGPTLVVPLGAEHADAVVAIYRAGVDEGGATFETAAPGRERFDAAELPEHRFATADRAEDFLGFLRTRVRTGPARAPASSVHRRRASSPCKRTGPDRFPGAGSGVA
ncbi:GNAT family N-acetyltransferase [Streptomyces sp. NPDC008122]|uniref:GNAT family N-acetyltransferase n=1 Tax=Streptomyces sp. NPDC008122 TaxID=3364810 RepID=UPI0036EF97DF